MGTKVSEAEFASLEERARGAGLTLGEWVREALLAEPEKSGAEVAGEVVLAELLALRTVMAGGWVARRKRCGGGEAERGGGAGGGRGGGGARAARRRGGGPRAARATRRSRRSSGGGLAASVAFTGSRAAPTEERCLRHRL